MIRPSSLLLGTALAAALIFVAGASAAPLDVHNPGFESFSGSTSVPAEWPANGAGTRTRDLTRFHAGIASLKLDTTAGYTSFAVVSNCFAAAPNTPYYLTFYYNTTDAAIDTLNDYVSWYSNAACTTGLGSAINIAPTATVDPGGTTWHFTQGSGTSPAGTLFAQVQLGLTCDVGSPNGCVAYYDDVKVDTTPTAVAVASLSARHTNTGVDITWWAASAGGTLGFNVWRSASPTGRLTKLNRSLIVAQGATYRYRDRTARAGKGYVYKLQVVRLDGSRAWAGTVAVAP